MGKRNKSELANIDHPKSKRTRDNESEVKNYSVPNNKSKKIVFDEDGNPEQQTEDISSNVTRNKSVQKSNRKKNKIDNSQSSTGESEQRKEQSNQSEDDEPKEEDIDKFCDEIEEEDNEQYENWVKLIEEKLTSNKKKS